MRVVNLSRPSLPFLVRGLDRLSLLYRAFNSRSTRSTDAACIDPHDEPIVRSFARELHDIEDKMERDILDKLR